MRETDTVSIRGLHHLNTILRAIRNVNQLIVSEKDPARLIRKTCRLLSATEGFLNAWIFLFDEQNQFRDAAQYGIGKDFTPLKNLLKAGERVYCVRQAIAKETLISIKTPSSFCSDCPLREKYTGRKALTVALSHGKKVYGTLTVSLKTEFLPEKETRELLKEIASDLAFALYSIEMEKRQERVNRAIKISEARFRTTLYSIGDAVITTDKQGRVQQMNPVAETLTGWKEREAAGKPLQKIFNIINEETRKPVENPVERVLREGVIVGLANHTLLISREGTEFPIADSGAPIWDDADKIDGVVLVFRDQTKEKEAQRAIREVKEYAENIIATIREPLLVLDGALHILSANRSFFQTFNLKEDEIRGRFIYEIDNRQWDIPRLRELLEQVLPANTSFNDFEITHNFEHLGRRTMLLNARRIYKDPPKTQLILLAFDDITERKQAAIKIDKSNRLYATLSQINHTIMRERDKQKLFQAVCHIAIRYGKFRLAWIGLVDAHNKRVKPVAFSGEGTDYLKEIEISATSALIGRGPTGRAIREGRGVAFNDLDDNPDFAPWRRQALERGYRSSAAFPIRLNKRVIGAFSVYAAEPHFFDQDEMALLKEAALDISFALEKLEEDATRRRMEKGLKESNEIINRSPAVAFYWKNEPGWPVEYVSQNVQKIFGYTAEEFMSGALLYNAIIHPEDREKVAKEVRKKIKEKQSNGFSQEYRVMHKNGAVVWVDDRTWVQRNERNEVSHYRGIVLDISERKAAEEALLKSEEKFRILYNASPDMYVSVSTKDGSILECNETLLKMTGYAKEEIIGSHIFKMYHDACMPEVKKVFKQFVETGVVTDKELILKRKDGSKIDVNLNVNSVRDKSGRILHSMSSWRDISAHKQAEREIRESEERFRLVFHTIPDAVSLSRLSDGVFIDVNATFCRITGYSRKEVIGKSALDLNIWVNPEERSRLQGEIENTGVSDRKEMDFRTRDGRVINAILSAGVLSLNKEKILLSIATDITEMKKSRDALGKSELKYKTLAEHTHDFEYWMGADGKYIYVSPSCKRITGYDADEFMDDPNTLFRMVHPAYAEIIKEHYQNENNKKELISGLEFPITTKQGQERWLEHHCTPVYDAQGNFLGRRGNNRDITDRKRAEAERERLAIAIEYAAEAVVITDINGDIQYVNSAFEKNSGYSRKEVMGENPRILKSGKQEEPFYRELWDTITGGKIWHGKLINRRKNGAFYSEETTISPVYTNGLISNFVAVKRDVTKEEELEQQFRQAQKMESVGRLAGGVAHDFNNMLSVILGYSELILARMSPQDKLYKNIEEIRKAGQRSADLTTQLLAFSRKQTISPRVVNLNDAVGNMLKMLRRLIGENIQLTWMPGARLGNIYLDPAQIDQLLANLCVNARDAIKDTGKIIIETKQVEFDEAYCAAQTYAEPGLYVMLSVSDNGCGMEREIKDKIFEPFFTTKAQGKGTGLGLATVYGIVKQNKGLIHVYSEPGKGSSFKLYFPLYSAPQEFDEKKEREPLPTGNGELILLVEDESSILELTQRMIENLGYSVMATTSPEEALLLAAGQKEEIALLLSDVVMPGMNGKQLAGYLQKIHSHMKVLYMSGYTSDVIANQGVLEEGLYFITKPFTLAELAKTLEEVLKS